MAKVQRIYTAECKWEAVETHPFHYRGDLLPEDRRDSLEWIAG